MATHFLSRPELGVVDKYRSAASGAALSPGSSIAGAAGVIFTANAAGTTTTLVGPAASFTGSGTSIARVGERFVLCDSTGKPKENKVFEITAHSGTTTITFTPAAAVATASGDKAVLVSGGDRPGGNPYADNDSLDAFLLDVGGIYTQAYIDKMTQNDKIYAIRQHQNPDAVK